MKRYMFLLATIVASMTAFSQVYVYKGSTGLYSEFPDGVDSIVYYPPYQTPLPAQNEGALSGVFSVSSTKKVRFSKGNLQYSIPSNTWQFAANQYDTVGGDITGILIDQFGYGTSGWAGGAAAYRPTETTTNNEDYETIISSLIHSDLNGYMQHRDWGIHNAITNGGNQAGLWRLLTGDEWTYLFRYRSWTPFAYAMVNGVFGFVLLPDNWSAPANLKLRPATYDRNWEASTSLSAQEIEAILARHHNDTLEAAYELQIPMDIPQLIEYDRETGEYTHASWSDYNITPSEWDIYESMGCVFFPFNRQRNCQSDNYYRNDTNKSDLFCSYWSSTYMNAPCLEINQKSTPILFTLRWSSSVVSLSTGACVRLVQDY